MSTLDSAIETGRARAAATPRIDYDRMNRVWPKQKAALTRAKNTGDPEKVADVVAKAIIEWDEIGAWPDDWALFERTLNDLLPWHQAVDIRDLVKTCNVCHVTRVPAGQHACEVCE